MTKYPTVIFGGTNYSMTPLKAAFNASILFLFYRRTSNTRKFQSLPGCLWYIYWRGRTIFILLQTIAKLESF